ncbi:MAG: VacB/RNase II family 3'-5' exoribonuclease [Planctomycetaceae bacterium]|nr:VacB/RNase II family 3'-5' exoribonuclease [Planctomycetaceae bacterium]
MLSPDEIRNGIIDIVTRSKYRPMKPRGFANELGIPIEQAAEVRRIVKRMINDGELVFGKKHLVWPGPNLGQSGLVDRFDRSDFDRSDNNHSDNDDHWLDEVHGNEKSESSNRERVERTAREPDMGKLAARGNVSLDDFIVGTFRQTEHGNGFVRPRVAPHDADAPPPADIFIPAEVARDAASGDLVVVELTFDPKRDAGKRRFDRSERDRPWDRQQDRRFGGGSQEASGPVGRIVEILERETFRFVGTYDCDDDVAVVEVDGKLFRTPIYVGDPSACPARTGDKVVIDMVRFPTHVRHGEGVVVEVLGPHGTPELDTLLIINQFGLPKEFPEEVIRSAQKIASQFEETIPKDRFDATEETTLTIDPEDARDFDDAVSLEKLECGHWRLGVHIADVAFFVQPGEPVDKEAYSRGTSVYLPDKVIPMLPEAISNSLASLQPDKLRFAKSVWIEMTEDGIPVDVEIKRTVIRSDARLNYDQVTEFIADPKQWRDKWRDKLKPDVFRLLGDMYALAMILRDRRMKRGALELTMPEIKLVLDDDGKVCGSKLAGHLPSNQIIEEFMLAANEAVAEYLEKRNVLFLRRIHALPTYRKMKQFAQFVKSLGIANVSPDTLLESRFEIQSLLERVKGRPEEAAVNFSLLRSMQKAVYSPEEEGHYALASSCYCHFTSPIRRYPDLTVHRLLDQVLTGVKPTNDLRELFLLGEHCSQQERNAEEAERELIKLKLINYLATKIGTRMTGVITGVERFGFFVQGEEIPAEGLVRIKSLEGRYFFDADTHTLTGGRGESFRLGDRVVIEIVNANPDTRRIDYKYVGSAPKPEKSTASKSTSMAATSKAETTKRKRSAKAVAPKVSSRFDDKWDNESDYDETGKPLRIRTSKTKRTDAKTQSKKKAVKSKTAPVKKPAKKAKKSAKKTVSKPLTKKAAKKSPKKR